MFSDCCVNAWICFVWLNKLAKLASVGESSNVRRCVFASMRKTCHLKWARSPKSVLSQLRHGPPLISLFMYPPSRGLCHQNGSKILFSPSEAYTYSSHLISYPIRPSAFSPFSTLGGINGLLTISRQSFSRIPGGSSTRYCHSRPKLSTSFNKKLVWAYMWCWNKLVLGMKPKCVSPLPPLSDIWQGIVPRPMST